ELPDYREGTLGGVGDYTMAAVGKSLEAHEMRRECCNEVLLAFDREHRILLTAEHEGWTLNARQMALSVSGDWPAVPRQEFGAVRTNVFERCDRDPHGP